MIDIVVNARYVAQPLTGVQRYATEIMRQLDEMLEEGVIDRSRFQVTLALPAGCENPPHYQHLLVHEVGRLQNNTWEQLSLARFAAGKILYNPCNTGPLLHNGNEAITIHDASVFALPQTYTFLFRTKYQILISLLGRKSEAIFTGSQFSKEELVRYCGLDAGRMQVVHLGHEHILNQPADDSLWNIHQLPSRPYLLAVGSQSFHKNSAGILLAMKSIPNPGFDLVMTGGVFSRVFKSIPVDSDLPIHRLGYVSDASLRSLYEHAAAFIYPSFYEGFGLPPLEAMACGCPVIVSRRASIPEICGDAVEYCDPSDPTDIARAVQRVMNDPEYRQHLIERGYKRVKEFTWRRAAEQIWAQLEKMADGP
jgi:glycosyltransferase involved in cell wall biosynthesis